MDRRVWAPANPWAIKIAYQSKIVAQSYEQLEKKVKGNLQTRELDLSAEVDGKSKRGTRRWKGKRE